MSSPTLSSRIHGSLFGLSICDALGGPVEFKRRGTFPLIDRLLPNANFSLPAGCFTDDTSMALCLAQSLIDSHGHFDAHDQVRKYLAWSRDGYMSSVPERGCFDIGVGTRLVLEFWEAHLIERDVEEVGLSEAGKEKVRAAMEEGQKGVDSRFGPERYCGNGSLMRVVPIALAFHAAGVEKAVAYAKESSRITHPHLRCQEACSLYVRLVVNTLQGSLKNALAEVVAAASIRDDTLRERLSVYKSYESWNQRTENSIRSTGYVVDTLEAALWAFFTTDTFEKGAVRVVNLGDDADTVGAVFGGLAGAYYGLDAIPDSWMRTMRNKDLLQKVADGLEGLKGGPQNTA